MPDNPLHLLLVIIDLHGGCGVYTRLLADGLRRYYPRQFSVSLLTFRDRAFLPSDPQTFDRVEILGSPVHATGLLTRGYETLAHTRQLRKTIRRLNPDALLSVGTYPNVLLPLATPKPVILTEHNHMSTRLATTRTGRLLTAMMRARYKRRPLVAPSEGVAADLRSHFHAANVVAIPHGLDRDRILSLSAESPPDLPPKSSYIVSVGRLTDQKDYPTLLRAYALARQQHLTQNLLILGDGPDLPQLQSLARSLGVAPHVTFLGHRDNPYPYLANARCYALSSIYEGFGLALLEAMTLSLPCAATDCPSGPAEILADGHFGPLTPPTDAHALSQSLLTLCTSDSAHQRYAALAAQRSHAYSLQSMATRYHDLIRSFALRP
jgi:glycosyltransferase involved in cell wall biosynthesis